MGDARQVVPTVAVGHCSGILAGETCVTHRTPVRRSRFSRPPWTYETTRAKLTPRFAGRPTGATVSFGELVEDARLSTVPMFYQMDALWHLIP